MYIAYVNFRNAFSSIDHPQLLVIMEDLVSLLDAIEIVGDIYTNFKTTVYKSDVIINPPPQ